VGDAHIGENGQPLLNEQAGGYNDFRLLNVFDKVQLDERLV
jgi:hypothetical protein